MIALVNKQTAVQDLILRYQQIRNLSIEICAPLKAEDYAVQPMPDVSPPKWHLGHVTWFFENFILVENIPNYELFNEKLNYFFNSYYESQGERILRSNRGNMTRPTTDTVLAYRRHVDSTMTKLLNSFENGIPKELAHLVEVGLQHEQQHQELLVTDIKYILGNNPLFPNYKNDSDYVSVETQSSPMNFIFFSEGIYEIGYNGKGFCWDNEMSVHKVFLHNFEIADRLVTNGEFLEFMEKGGYGNYEYWLSEGWEWAKKLDIKAPLYWYKKDDQWYQYTMRGLEKVNLNEPATHISYFEADAFAQWKGMRLPTEFEWEVACKKLYSNIPEDGNFLDTQNFHPIAPQSKRDYQMLGNTWEWTGSAYLAYPNYPRFAGALGEYNGKFMCNQMVLRGGSCATPKSHIRPTYRNFFPTNMRWQFTGFRLVK